MLSVLPDVVIYIEINYCIVDKCTKQLLVLALLMQLAKLLEMYFWLK